MNKSRPARAVPAAGRESSEGFRLGPEEGRVRQMLEDESGRYFIHVVNALHVIWQEDTKHIRRLQLILKRYQIQDLKLFYNGRLYVSQRAVRQILKCNHYDPSEAASPMLRHSIAYVTSSVAECPKAKSDTAVNVKDANKSAAHLVNDWEKRLTYNYPRCAGAFSELTSSPTSIRQSADKSQNSSGTTASRGASISSLSKVWMTLHSTRICSTNGCYC